MRRALLLGAQTHGLLGVEHDVEVLSVALASRGFNDIRTVTGPDATRRGIVAAVDSLLLDATAGDDIVLAYSGHGARVRLVDAGAEAGLAAGTGGYLRMLVPVDLEASTPTHFRGLLDAEVTSVQRALAATCRSVTTILDCCHSGAFARGSDTPKALPEWRVATVETAGAAQLLAAARRRNTAVVLGPPPAHLIRLAACAEHELAYEASVGGGQHVGVLTSALVAVLDDIGATPVRWAEILPQIRAAMLELRSQRAVVEGDLTAGLFGAAVMASGPVALPAEVRRGVVVGGALLGLVAGGRLDVHDAQGASLGTAEVTTVHGIDAAFTSDSGVLVSDLGSTVGSAVIRDPGRRWLTVLVTGFPDDDAATCAQRLQELPGVRAVTEDRGGADVPPDVVVRKRAGLEVVDSAGRLWRSGGADNVDAVARTIETLARAALSTMLARHYCGDGLTMSVEADGPEGWAAVAPDAGIEATQRLRVRLRLDSSGDTTPWLTSLLLIDPAARSVLMTAESPEGRPLLGGESTTVGFPHGFAVPWAGDLPADGPRWLTLVGFASTQPVDLRILQSQDPPWNSSLLVRGSTTSSPEVPVTATSSRDEAVAVAVSLLVQPPPRFDQTITAPDGLAGLRPRGPAVGAVSVRLDVPTGTFAIIAATDHAGCQVAVHAGQRPVVVLPALGGSLDVAVWTCTDDSTQGFVDALTSTSAKSSPWLATASTWALAAGAHGVLYGTWTAVQDFGVGRHDLPDGSGTVVIEAL